MIKYLIKIFLIVSILISASEQLNAQISVTPDTILLKVKSGNLTTGYIDVSNLEFRNIYITIDVDTSWMFVYPDEFNLAPNELKKLTACFFIPDGEEPSRTGKITFRAKQLVLKDIKITNFEKSSQSQQIGFNERESETTSQLNDSPIAQPTTQMLPENIDVVSNHKADDIIELKKIIRRLEEESQQKDLKISMLLDKIAEQRKRDNEMATPYTEKMLSEINNIYQELINNLHEEIHEKLISVKLSKDKIFITISGQIAFSSGSVKLKLKSAQILKEIVTTINKNQGYDKIITICGHSDNQPIGSSLSNRYHSNWELSAFRSAVVARVLNKVFGYDGNKLMVAAFSNYQPISNMGTPEGREENRRIELIISNKDILNSIYQNP